jgi:hypothetical protein
MDRDRGPPTVRGQSDPQGAAVAGYRRPLGQAPAFDAVDEPGNSGLVDAE